MEALDRLVSFDTIIIFALLSFAIQRTTADFKVTRIKPLLIASGPLLVCVYTFLCAYFGVKNDPRRNALVILCIVFATRSTFVVYILWMGFNGAMRRLPRVVSKTFFKGFSGILQVYEEIRSPRERKHPPRKTVRLLTTEIASSREGAAYSWLASTGARFKHWTVLADGQCYELGRSRRSTLGTDVLYEPRIQPYDEWRIRRGLAVPGITIKMDTYYVGNTTFSHEEISEEAHKIWKNEFGSQYNLTSQNCQDFSYMLAGRIYYSRDGAPSLRRILKERNGPRKLSTVYYRVTLPVKVPFLLTRWLAKSTIGSAYYYCFGESQQADHVKADKTEDSTNETVVDQSANEFSQLLNGAAKEITTDGEVFCIVEEREVVAAAENNIL